MYRAGAGPFCRSRSRSQTWRAVGAGADPAPPRISVSTITRFSSRRWSFNRHSRLGPTTIARDYWKKPKIAGISISSYSKLIENFFRIQFRLIKLFVETLISIEKLISFKAININKNLEMEPEQRPDPFLNYLFLYYENLYSMRPYFSLFRYSQIHNYSSIPWCEYYISILKSN